MFKITSNLDEVIGKWKAIAQNPKPLMVSLLQKKCNKVICPAHHTHPEVIDGLHSKAEVQVKFCCEKQKEMFQNLPT